MQGHRRNGHTRELRRNRKSGPPRDAREELRSLQTSIGELLNGEVHTRRWTDHHVRTYDTILGALGGRDGLLSVRHGWMFDFRPEIHVEQNIVVADFAGWRSARRVQPERDTPIGHYSSSRYTARPDWVCDIVEPSNEAFIYKTKKPFYYYVGVSWLWILDTRKNILEIHAAGQRDWQLLGTFRGSGCIRARPLDHISVSLDACHES